MKEGINLKSDVNAKKAFVVLLASKGYQNIKIVSSPADIIASKNGKTYYFEVKFTNQTKNYFGAATLTEWATAIENPDNFKFVVARKNGEFWQFEEYPPQEFIKHNTIPPFKTYFNLSLNKDSTKKSAKKKKSIQLTEEKLKKMEEFWNSLKD